MLLSDLQHSFDVIGLSETKIKSNCDLTSNIAIEGFDFVKFGATLVTITLNHFQ